MNTHGIVKDGLGQDQPEDKKRALQKTMTTAKAELPDYEKTQGAGTLPGPRKNDDVTSG